MSDLEIVNPLAVEHAEPWIRQLATSLLGNPYDDDFARRVRARQRRWDPERTWGVRDRGRWIATLATEQRVLTVPGPGVDTHDVVVDALTAVSVSATHRRRGLLTRMIGRSLDAAKHRGDPLSMLIAAEWPIYGRFGYAPATSTAHYHYHPRQSGLGVDFDRTSVRQVDPDELGPIATAVFDVARRRRAGQVDRDASWWDRQLGLDDYEPMSGSQRHWFVHEGADGPDGMLAWKATREVELEQVGAVTASHLIAASFEAERDLWGYLSGIDAVDAIELPERSVDEPARWLLRDGRALTQRESVDFLWVRILDVPGALTARSYANDGRVVLDVVDTSPGGYAQGRFALTVEGGRATCESTDEASDLRLDQRTLAGSYLGGHRLLQLAGAQRPSELTPGALAAVDLMFSTPLPPMTQTAF